MTTGQAMTGSGRDGPITVIGATGQQGGAVIDALLKQRIPIRAVTRNPNGEKARALAERGVEVVYADLEDVDSVRAAFDGAAAAFAMTTHDGLDGPKREVAHGRVIAAAAADAGLPSLVYSSVGGVERGSGVPHFESKHRVEEVLLEAVPVTFVRPTFFMETLRLMIRRHGDRVIIAMPLPGDVAVQMISVRDIGRVAAAALLLMGDPSVAPVEIAGDELTGEQIAERIAHRLGSPTTYVQLPLDVLGDDEDLKMMFGWLARLPAYQADFARTRELVGGVQDLSRWLVRVDGLRARDR
jgi:uncharacterized protein YbjT (DUF2867 family)